MRHLVLRLACLALAFALAVTVLAGPAHAAGRALGLEIARQRLVTLGVRSLGPERVTGLHFRLLALGALAPFARW